MLKFIQLLRPILETNYKKAEAFSIYAQILRDITPEEIMQHTFKLMREGGNIAMFAHVASSVILSKNSPATSAVYFSNLLSITSLTCLRSIEKILQKNS